MFNICIINLKRIIKINKQKNAPQKLEKNKSNKINQKKELTKVK